MINIQPINIPPVKLNNFKVTHASDEAGHYHIDLTVTLKSAHAVIAYKALQIILQNRHPNPEWN